MPKTKMGKWSVILIIVSFLMFALFQILVSTGQRGGDKFFDNLFLTIPFLLTACAGICSFFTGIISIFRSRERSVFVFISTIIGFLILVFVTAEIFFQH